MFDLIVSLRHLANYRFNNVYIIHNFCINLKFYLICVKGLDLRRKFVQSLSKQIAILLQIRVKIMDCLYSASTPYYLIVFLKCFSVIPNLNYFIFLSFLFLYIRYFAVRLRTYWTTLLCIWVILCEIDKWLKLACCDMVERSFY